MYIYYTTYIHIHCNIWIDTYVKHIWINMYIIEYVYIYICIFILYCILTFVIMKVLWTSKSRPSKTEHNEKKKAIPAAEFSMSFAASAVWPPATGTEVWDKADFLVLSFRFRSFPFVKGFQKKNGLTLKFATCDFPQWTSVSFPSLLFWSNTDMPHTLGEGPPTPLFVSRDGKYISEFTWCDLRWKFD